MTGGPLPAAAAALQRRVRFRERQVLLARDLVAEQRDRLQLRRRHDRGHHRWGIVAGLDLVEATGGFLLQPGTAVDGYGRHLAVDGPCSIPESIFDRQTATAVDVWLLWRREPVTPPRRGHDECGPGRHSRWQEGVFVRLEPTDPEAAMFDARNPPWVPKADLGTAACDVVPGSQPQVGPERSAPDDPELVWPVYLGRIERRADGTLAVNRQGRPYAALAGEAVTAPAGDARMQVGSEQPGDRDRFAVALGEPATRRLSIDAAGGAAIRGHTRLDGHLTIAKAERWAWGVQLGRLAAAPEAAAPWQLYRTPGGEEAADVEQLRFEIGNPGDKGDPKRYRLVIGGVGADGEFTPCLTVRSDCTVIVHGLLVAEQLVVLGPAKADPSDPRLATELTRQWVENVVAAGVNLDAELQSRIEAAVAIPSPPKAGQQMSYDVTITNAGPVELRGVAITGVITIAGAVVFTQTDRRDTPLAPKGTTQTTADFNVPPDKAGKTLEVIAVVAASGPFGFPAVAEGRRSAPIGSS